MIVPSVALTTSRHEISSACASKCARRAARVPPPVCLASRLAFCRVFMVVYHTIRLCFPFWQAVLRFVGDAARHAAASGAGSQLRMAFFATLACEFLAARQAQRRHLDEATVGVLLPHVRAGLAKVPHGCHIPGSDVPTRTCVTCPSRASGQSMTKVCTARLPSNMDGRDCGMLR